MTKHIQHEIGLGTDILINGGIFLFLYVEFGLAIAGISIAFIKILLVMINVLLDES
jgi:hypothetical protein